MTLPPEAKNWLVKICGMFGSTHAGERAAAALKAHNLLAEHGADWADVLSGLRLPAALKAQRRARYPEPAAPPGPMRVTKDHQREGMILLKCSSCPWDEWKRKFLTSIMNRQEELTPSQKAKLRECRQIADEWRERQAA